MNIENAPSFQEFLKLLGENGRSVQGQDFSLMAWYLEGMDRQFDAVLQELRAVKAELAQVMEQQALSKPLLTKMVETLTVKVKQAQERLAAFQSKIMACAKSVVDRFKDAGVLALDSAVAAMGIKKGLEHLQGDLQNSLSSVKDTLGKAEEMGKQLRTGFRNIANAGRIAANQELDLDPKIEEGRFQSAVLAPIRGVQKLLSNINNNTLAAIGVVEHLEQSADMARERQAERETEKSGKRLEKKPSIRQALKKNQADIAAKAALTLDKDKKQEAAL